MAQSFVEAMSSPIIVSYYTPGTHYEDHAKALAQSAKRLGLDVITGARSSKASWVENCGQKAAFLRDVWNEVQRPILWIDADARIIRRPTIVENLATDFAAIRIHDWLFHGGQIYFGKTDAASELLERWQFYCNNYPYVWDQVSLGYAWWDMAVDQRINATWLPASTKIAKPRALSVRRMAGYFYKRFADRPFFLHYQESRRSKPKFDRESPRREFASRDIPQWWRDACRSNAPFKLSSSQRQELGIG